MLIDHGYTKERLQPKIQHLHKLYNDNLNLKAQNLQLELGVLKKKTKLHQNDPIKSEKMEMERLFLEVIHLRKNMPVATTKAMWDDMFGPQLRFEGDSHRLYERKNLASRTTSMNRDINSELKLPSGLSRKNLKT